MKLESTAARQARRARTSGRVQRKAMPGEAIVANHVSADAGLERQADEAAGRVVAGETNVARVLTPAPTARAEVPTSTAEPLPAAVRSEMEAAFGADFEAVRIHRDSPGQAAARSEHAAAFAAGAHVFFGEGLYDPTSRTGLHLLAHELAHVLQQTGRRETVDMIHATDRSGDGGIQLAPANGVEVIKGLKDKHSANNSKGDVGLMKAILEVDKLIKGWSRFDLPAPKPHLVAEKVRQWAIDDALPSAPATKLTPKARSYLFDILKMYGPDPTGYYEDCFNLLDKDSKFEMETAFAPPGAKTLRNNLKDLVETKKTGVKWNDWIGEAYATPKLKKLFEETLANTFATFFMNPWRPVQGLTETVPGTGGGAPTPPVTPKLQLDKDIAELEDNAALKQTGPLGPTERVILAFYLLRDYDDQERIKLQMGWAQDEKKRIERYGAVDQRQSTLLIAIDWAKKRATDPDTSPRWKRLAEIVKELAERAKKYWDGIFKEEKKAESAAFDFSSLDLLGSKGEKALRLKLPDHPALKQFGVELQAQADLFFYLDRDKDDHPVVPTSSEYAARIKAFREGLGFIQKETGAWSGAALGVQGALEAQFLQRKETSDLARAFGILLTAFNNLETKLLKKFDPAVDAKEPFADKRLAHRIRVARAIAAIGRFFGWQGPVTAAGNVLRAEDFGSTQLAIISGWEPDPEVKSISRIITDFPKTFNKPIGGEVKKWALGKPIPLTIEHIVLFYQGDFLVKLADELRLALTIARVESIAKGRPAQPHLKETVERLQSYPKPKRYKVTEWEVAVKRDAEGEPDMLLPDLLQTHAQTVAYFKPLLTANSITVFPPEYGQLFGWVIPDIAPVVKVLQEDKTLNDVVNPDNKLTDPFKWLEVLVEKQKDGSIKGNFQNYFKRKLEKKLDEGSKEAAKQLREMTIYERRFIRDVTLKEKLPKFSGGDKIIVADWITDQIRAFVTIASPVSEQEAEVAALILSMAEKLAGAFAPSEGGLLSTDWLNWLVIARKYATTAMLSGDLKRVLDGDDIGAWQDRANDVDKILKAYYDAAKEMQDRFGLKSDGYSLGCPSNSFVIEPGPEDSFVSDNVHHELVKVHRPFEYRPAFKTNPAVYIENGSPVTPTHTPLFTFGLSNKDLSAKPKGTGVDPEEAYNADAADDVTVYADEPDRLNEFTKRVFDRTYALQMQNLGEVVQESYELILDVVELVPGVGQAVTVARAVTAALEAVASDNFRHTFEDLWHNPKKLIDKIKGYFSALDEDGFFEPVNLILFVLFNDPPPILATIANAVAERSVSKPGDTPIEHAPTSKVGKILHRLQQVARRIAQAVIDFRLRFRGPVRGFQAEIVSRPSLAFALGLAAEYFDVVAEFLADAVDGPGLKSDLLEALTDDKAFAEKVTEFIATLEQLELPDRIIPNDLVAQALLDFGINMVAKKLGTKGKIVALVATKLGLTKIFAEQIDKWMSNSDIDPNRAWQAVKPDVAEWLGKIRTDFVNELYGLLDLVGIQMPSRPKPTGPVALEGAGPEAQPLASPDREPDGERIDLSGAAGGGEPLSPAVRSSAETRFGHDFSHVRLHEGTGAADVTGAAGAEALTSGSHVWLRPGLSSGGGEGAHVLDHELAHVVQQTGARPLGGEHDHTPTLGTPGVGLREDAHAEAAADHAASAAHGAASGPMSIGGAGGGIQPKKKSFAEAVRSAVLKFTRVPKATAFKVPGVLATTVVTGYDEKAAPLWAAVIDALSGTGKAIAPSYKKTFQAKKVKDAISTLVSTKIPAKDLAIKGIAKVAQRVKPGQKSDKDKKKSKETYLHFPTFLSNLQGYVYATCGIGIEFKTTDDKLTGLSVYYVDLGIVPLADDLWQILIKNNKLKPEDAAQLHERLAYLPPSPGVWDSNEYKLNAKYLLKFRGIQTKEGDPTAIPTASEYKETSASAALPKSGRLGVRVSTHGDLKSTFKPDERKGRQSHHIPQFLLVNYFRNRKVDGKTMRTTAFPEKAKKVAYDYTGLDVNVGTDGNIESVGSIKLADLDTQSGDKRGSDMPAILLAKETHTRGRLHVTPETWEDAANLDAETATQRDYIDLHFKRQLPDEMQKGPDSWNKYIAKPANLATAKAAIPKAMNETYGWMYTKMRDALVRALPQIEVASYRGIVEKLKVTNPSAVSPASDYELDPSTMAAVVQAVDTKNTEVMVKKGGWSKP